MSQNQYWKTENFKNLQKEWNEKLNESGFKDYETQNTEDPQLQKTSTLYFFKASEKAKGPEVQERVYDYFQKFLYHVDFEQFESQSHEIIIRMFASGSRIFEIQKILKDLGLKNSDRQTIRYIIRRFETKYNIRSWKNSQLSSTARKQNDRK